MIYFRRIVSKILNEEQKSREFTKDELEKIIKLCKEKENVTYLDIKNLISLKEDEYFKNIDFFEIDKKTGEFTSKKTKFKHSFKAFHKIRKVASAIISEEETEIMLDNKNLINEIIKTFTFYKDDTQIRANLEKLLSASKKKDELIEAFIQNLHFSETVNLSIKAIENLLSHMKDGKRYDEAIKECQYKSVDFQKEKFLRALNKDEQLYLTNPVVKRALAQTRKVINTIIRKYGQFDKVHIELTREIKKSHKDRKSIKEGQEKYQQIKQGVVENFKELFTREPKGNELLKFRLWKEQDQRCIYSGEHIDSKKFIEDVNYAQIDHILPFSRSLEDNINNKVLCLAKENQNKKDQTPYEYFKNSNKDWHYFEEFVKNCKNIKKPKRQRLLKKNFDENSQKEFKERNLNDTAFATIFIKDFIANNLELNSKDKTKVLTRNGALTSMLRHNFGLSQKARDNHLHHAIDAIVVAFATQSEVQRLSTLSAKIDGFNYTKSEKKADKLKFIPPLENFRSEVQNSIDEIFVSFAPRKSISGEAHKQTIKSKNIKIKSAFEVNKGHAQKGEIKRIDVFLKKGKYHFVSQKNLSNPLRHKGVWKLVLTYLSGNRCYDSI